MRDLIKYSGKFYGMQISMTKQSGEIKKCIFTIITHNKNDLRCICMML